MLIEFEVNRELPIGLVILLPPEGLEQVSDTVRGECRLAKDAHDLKHWSADFEVMFDDGNEAVRNDGNMNLNTHGILGLSPEPLDLEMLLDPFEEKLHLPSVLIKEGDFFRLEVEVVRVVNKAAVQFGSIVDDTPNDTRILLLVLLFGEADSLVFEHVVGTIKNTLAVDNLIVRPALLPNDEEGSENMDPIEPGEVKVASVKHIAGQSLVCEPVHRVDIVHFGIGDSIEHGYLRDDVNLGVDPNARLRAFELCPSEHCHAEVDGRGVDGIELAVQLKLLSDALGLGDAHHVEGKLLKDTVVSEKIGLREHLPIDGLNAKSKVFRLLSMGNCYICKLPQASAADELPEQQYQHVVPVRHRPPSGPVVVLGYYTPEMPLWEELNYLCENELSNMHTCSGLKSDAKVRISKPGQGIGELKHCA